MRLVHREASATLPQAMRVADTLDMGIARGSMAAVISLDVKPVYEYKRSSRIPDLILTMTHLC